MSTSKTCWKRFEYDIRDLIGGCLQYAQSVKFFVRKEKLALGDVKNKYVLAECKVRDYATKKFRKEHPAKPYKSFNIEFAWWEQLVQECSDVNHNEKVNRVAVLFVKPKFGRKEHVLVLISRRDWERWMAERGTPSYGSWFTEPDKQNDKSITITYGKTVFPTMFVYNGEIVHIMDLKLFEAARNSWYEITDHT